MKEKLLRSKTAVVLVVVTFLQIVSWYFASPKFFLANLNPSEESSKNLAEAYIYWFSMDTLLLLVVPILIIKFLFGERISDYGLNLLHMKNGLRITLISFVVMTILIWLFSSFTDLSQLHSQITLAEHSTVFIIFFELLLFLYVLSWEFIWRGFMIFGLEKDFGMNVIFIQMLPFVLLHFNKNIYEVIGAIFGGIFLGLLSYKTRSIIYGVFIHYLVLIAADVISNAV